MGVSFGACALPEFPVASVLMVWDGSGRVREPALGLNVARKTMKSDCRRCPHAKVCGCAFVSMPWPIS